ncbi:hypothetical protein BB559_005001 [Furculomyces boomerangus]|uniref:CMP/dCMP-type deaminase domain-containing protein n=1 Tax=Furculomyces boomerangus TaxID=61424 RepID=A0A2T9YBD9_9FUNG|nr:hypothetical protein BB559_005001 [Furculomyces boomerangus]
MSNVPNDENYHSRFMTEAFKYADEAYNIGEVPIGCVFVHNGKVVAGGRNATNETKNGTQHAELIAINKLLSPQNSTHFTPQMFKETTLYVTVEPCIMCSYALRQLGNSDSHTTLFTF